MSTQITDPIIKRIHVNQHHIRSNQTKATQLPTLTVKTSRANYKGNRIVIAGPSDVVYSPNKPLSCGARVWIETHSDVEVLD